MARALRNRAESRPTKSVDEGLRAMSVKCTGGMGEKSEIRNPKSEIQRMSTGEDYQ